MLQIRLSKGSSLDGGTGTKSSPVETVTVACPDHLVLADLPVAKGLGSATAASIVKVVGRRSRRQLGERVHFCVRCDFPIAVYGRLSPCEHAFCLDCARSDSICYLCDERIQKIQTIKMMEGIFICAAPHCLKSFLKKPDFESHIHHHHSDLLHPNAVKNEDQIEPDAFRGQHSTSSESNPRAPARPGFPPGSNPQFNDRDDKARAHTPRDQVPPRPLMHPNLNPASFYGPNNHTEIQHENRPEAGTHQDMGGQFPPMYPHLPPGFPVPGNPNGMLLNPPPFGFPPFPTDGGAPPAPLYGGGPAMLAPPLPPGPPPPHVVQQKQGWQPERRDSFGSSQD